MLKKVRLDKDKTGRTEFGLRHTVPSHEIKKVLKYCAVKREKERVLGLKPDSYSTMYDIPQALDLNIRQDNQLGPRDSIEHIIERDYPAFKTTN